MVNQKSYISDAVIRRLPRYYRYLGELLTSGVSRISSGELSQKMGLTASQIRQDFNHFGGFGQQGYGYNVEMLHEEIGKILGIQKPHNVIIIGAGHIGSALANYQNFENRGFHVIAVFDSDPEVIGTKVSDLTVLSDSCMESFLKENIADIAVIAIPKAQAPAVAERAVNCGIRGIWNFASTDLDIKNKDVVVENVHLTDSIMRLSYRLENNSTLL